MGKTIVFIQLQLTMVLFNLPSIIIQTPFLMNTMKNTFGNLPQKL